jgi:hypothetical protein
MRLLLALLLPLAVAWAGPTHPMEEAIRAAMEAEVTPGLTLVFDDVHPLYGGALFELAADGSLKRTDVPRAQQEPTVTTTRLDEAERAALLALLAGIEAWEQRVPDRTPVPDESRAHLGLRLDGAESTVWEWANDLGDNARIVQVQRFLDARLPAGAP